MMNDHQEVIQGIEVFKTDVMERGLAAQLIQHIQNSFVNYTASFDLDDCDRILVVKCTSQTVQASWVIELLKKYGCHAEVLVDE
jgi:hypothetical protein